MSGNRKNLIQSLSHLLKPVAGTTGLQLMAALVQAGITLYAARILGNSAMGEVSLVLLCVLFTQVIAGIAGGGAIVYLATRIHIYRILNAAYTFSIVAALTIPYLFYYLGYMYEEHIVPAGILAFMLSVQLAQSQILLAHKKHFLYNLISLIQPIGIAAGFLISFHVLHQPALSSFIIGYFTGYGLSLLLSMSIFLQPFMAHDPENPLPAPNIFSLGFKTQAANIAQTLNYRFSYMMIFNFYGAEALGNFVIANQFTEWMWKLPRSFAVVHYPEIASLSDPIQRTNTTSTFTRMSFWAGLLFTVVMLFVPEEWLLRIVGEQYRGMKEIILILLPGAFLYCGAIIFASHFSGIGRHGINTNISFTMLIITVLSIIISNNLFDETGMYIAISACYGLTFLISLRWLKKQGVYSLRNLFPRIRDLKFFNQRNR
jgi:O-antigen/teichoic acid export membrane protein